MVPGPKFSMTTSVLGDEVQDDPACPASLLMSTARLFLLRPK